MSAQINLYNPALQKQRDWLSGRSVGLTCSGVLGLMVAICGYISFIAGQAESNLKVVQAESQNLQARLLALGQEVAARPPDARLLSEVESTRARLNGRQQVLQALQQGSLGSTEGFSKYMQAFSRQCMSGLWLTGFDLGAGGGGVEIRGRMTNQALLPEYIRRLTSEALFSGRAFAALEMRGVVEDSDSKGDAIEADKSSANSAPARYVEFVLRPQDSAGDGARK